MTEVLVMSFSHIGDAVLSTCVVEPLRALYAPARIVFLAGPLPAALLRAEPGIDEVILHSRESHGGLLGRARLVRELRRRRFDVVVDLKDAVYSRLMGAKRIGLRDRGRTHAVDRYLRAVRAAGGDAPPCPAAGLASSIPMRFRQADTVARTRPTHSLRSAMSTLR